MSPENRRKYQQNSKIASSCRVCLQQNVNSMRALEETGAFAREWSWPEEYRNMSVLNAIEKVTSTKLYLTENCPRNLCLICFASLKSALRFILQFEETERELKNMGVIDDKASLPFHVDSNPVSIIFGKNKYDLADLILVEKEEDTKTDFKGFLNNLGKEISASFAPARLNKRKPTEEEINVTVSLIDKKKGAVPVKELQLIEGTEKINCFIVDEEEVTVLEEEEIKFALIDSSEDEEESKMEVGDYYSSTENQKDVVKLSLPDTSAEIVMMDKEVVANSEPDKYIKEEAKEHVDRTDSSKKCGMKRKKNNDGEVVSPKTCGKCNKVFGNRQLLVGHIWRVHSNKTYICKICGKENATRSAYKHHNMSKHVGKQWSCHICNKSFYTKTHCKYHLETHTDFFKYLCNVCGKGFHYPNALEYHMRLHTGEKKYVCHVCDKRFRMPSQLQRHIKTHTGERPYKCKFCDRGFFSTGEQKNHEMTHTGQRPFKCKYCQKGFIKAYNLNMHLLSHEGPYMCDWCGKSFADMNILIMHNKMKHKDKEEEEQKGVKGE